MRRLLPTALSLVALAATAASPNRFSLVRSDSGNASGDAEAGLFSLDEDTLRLACLEEAPERAADGEPAVAILCHGFMGRKESPLFDAISKALRAKGVAVARFDFNGHGESEGSFGRMTVSNEVLDVETVVDYYRNVRGARVALVGHSQGGVVAALAAARLGADSIEALALLAPAGVLRDDAVRERTRLYNRLHDLICQACPALEAVFAKQKLHNELELMLVARYGGPNGFRRSGRARASKWAGGLKHHKNTGPAKVGESFDAIEDPENKWPTFYPADFVNF